MGGRAAEVSIPQDPVKATLALVSSNVCKVDVARVEVTSLAFPPITQEDQKQSPIRHVLVIGSSIAQPSFFFNLSLSTSNISYLGLSCTLHSREVSSSRSAFLVGGL